MNGLQRITVTLGALIAVVASSNAAIYTLTDTGTSASIDTSSTAGLYDWMVAGVDQVFSNTYLWRVGDSGTADYVQNLTEISSAQTGNRLLDVSYRDAGSTFRIDLTYLLTGGTNTFDIAEVGRVTNTSNSAITFRFFQFNDFDLNQTASNDTVTRINSSQMKQVDGAVSLTMLNQGATPVPSFSELGNQFNIWNSLVSTNGYNLDSVAGANIGQSFTGDAGYGFQWNVVLNPGESFTISTDKVAAVPEPATMAIFGLGALGLLRRRRKQN